MRCHLVQDLVPQQDVAKDKESGAAHALYRPLCRISSAPHAAETVRQPMKVDGRHSRRQMVRDTIFFATETDNAIIAAHM